MEDNKYLIIGLILLVILLIVTIIVAYYYDRYTKCATYANIWCWTDWVCPYSCAPGQTGICWQGATSMYASLTICDIVNGDTSIPEGCTCAWADTVIGTICN